MDSFYNFLGANITISFKLINTNLDDNKYLDWNGLRNLQSILEYKIISSIQENHLFDGRIKNF